MNQEEKSELNSNVTDVQDQENNETFIQIDRLESFGINVSDIKRIKEFGVFTIASMLNLTMKKLTSIKGFSEAKAEKVCQAGRKLVPRGFRSATDALLKRSSIFKVTTGSAALDTMLCGGIESMAITELFGEFRTGKTQLCLTLCVTSQLPRELGGGAGKVVYIDTEGCFRPERIQDIARRFNLDPDVVLENIIWGRAYTHEEQMRMVQQAAAKIVEDESVFRVLIIDSATALFRTDFSGRGELAERQQRLNQHLSALKKLAEEFNIAVVIVNQVTADPGGASMFAGDIKKPIGGHIMAHSSTTRLYLRKGKGNLRICQVYDSPLVAQSEATFSLSLGGVDDE